MILFMELCCDVDPNSPVKTMLAKLFYIFSLDAKHILVKIKCGLEMFPTDALSDGHTVRDLVWRQIQIGQFIGQFFISPLDDVGHFK